MLDSNSTNISPLAAQVPLAFLMSLFAFAITLGNAVVILAFVVDRNLRHRSNYFFLNLAISDFFVEFRQCGKESLTWISLIFKSVASGCYPLQHVGNIESHKDKPNYEWLISGAVSIPLYAPHTLFNWNLGSRICMFWLITDYLLCTASVYNIVLISYDRYQSVSNAVSYRAQHTGIVKIVAQMVAVWILAFLVNGPMILVSDSWKNSTNTQECEPGFVTEWYILTITTVLEFLLPVVLVAYFNVQIYRSLWKRGSLSRHPSHSGFIAASSSDSGHSRRAGLACRTSLPGLKESAASLHSESPRRKGSLLASLRTHMNSRIISFKVGSFSRTESAALHQREHVELLRGRKLARSLAILLSAFAVCWAPYCLSTIVLSTYPRGERPTSVWYSLAFWLQWFNSFINPFLYPLCHRRFQKAFWKILRVTKQQAPSQNQSVSS